VAESSQLAFIYVSLVGTALAITLFVIRRYSKIKNNNEEKPILNKCDELRKQMTFSKSHLLQFNATIIAGLFILLTIQNTVAGGLPALIDFQVTKDEVDKYKEIMNDDKNDQIIRDEAKKRFAEATLDSEKRQIQRDAATRFHEVQLLLHPTSYLLFAMLLFVSSCLVALASKNDNGRAFRTGEGFTISGLISMFTALLIMIVIPSLY